MEFFVIGADLDSRFLRGFFFLWEGFKGICFGDDMDCFL